MRYLLIILLLYGCSSAKNVKQEKIDMNKSLRPACCGKKRKMSQVYWKDGYDGGVWKCKSGFGCMKPEPPKNVSPKIKTDLWK